MFILLSLYLGIFCERMHEYSYYHMEGWPLPKLDYVHTRVTTKQTDIGIAAVSVTFK